MEIRKIKFDPKTGIIVDIQWLIHKTKRPSHIFQLRYYNIRECIIIINSAVSTLDGMILRTSIPGDFLNSLILLAKDMERFSEICLKAGLFSKCVDAANILGYLSSLIVGRFPIANWKFPRNWATPDQLRSIRAWLWYFSGIIKPSEKARSLPF